MTNSVASALDDSTPSDCKSDSGVQLMDSMSSDMIDMNESFMSNFGLESPSGHKQGLTDVDEFSTIASILPDVVMASESELINQNAKDCIDIDEIALTKSDIDNSNIGTEFLVSNDTVNDIPDEMKTSTCSTFDTDAIVFRRKVRKPRTSSTSSGSGGGGSVKKRVSFHEEVLKNTKTDNVRIERGFITYKGGSNKLPYHFLRNSWCSQGQCEEDYRNNTGHACYRSNACSDLLDYGQVDVYDQHENIMVPFDNSGIFEYVPRETNISPPLLHKAHQQQIQKAASNEEHTFYHCKCSESNSSLESNDNANGNDNKRADYSKTKSISCDCIGQCESNKINNNGSPNMTDNCYFSEPCIETMYEYEVETNQPKSVWRKELKPKSSCLKKTVRDTSVILEHNVSTKVKKFNVHQLPDVNNLFGSLKNIFSTIPERGVPEGCEDMHNVYECIPETDSTMKCLMEQTKTQLKLSPNQEQAQNIQGSKSKRKPELSLFPIPSADDMMHVTIADDTMNLEAEEASPCRPTIFRNKFIVNCESTVFEHTGVFEQNMHDIPEFPNSSSNCVTPQKQSKSILNFSTVSVKQKIGSIFSSFRSSGSSTKTSSANNSPKSASTQCLFLERQMQQEQLQAQLKKLQEEQMVRSWNSSYDYYKCNPSANNPFDADLSMSMTSSIISNSSDKNSGMSSSTMTTSTNTTSNQEHERFNIPKFNEKTPSPSTSSPKMKADSSPKKKTRHLESPLRRKSSTSNFDRSNLSPDLFCGQRNANQNPMVLLSEEFDDLLTVTTTGGDIEPNENDIEIVDYSTAVSEAEAVAAQLKSAQQQRSQNQFLRPPSTKSSLINRFLRNVTQKKINDIAVKKNIIMSNKFKDKSKPLGNLYVKPKKPIKVIQKSIMDDFNAEIAQEMAAAANTACGAVEVEEPIDDESEENEDYCVGVGEVSIDFFDTNQLHILRDEREKLIKVSCNF